MVIKPESKLVDEVVGDILKKLRNMSTSSDCKGLVDRSSRIEKIKSLLCIGLSEFRVIGIWGMGGIGKTTLAGVVFNQISRKFEGCYFRNINVKEELEKSTLIQLRDQVLSNILEENIHIGTPDIPRYVQERLKRKKVLIVLDDVNSLEQLEILVGGHDRFGSESRIIITTRDRQVLYNYGVHNIYEVEAFNHDEALQLFHNYAFKQDDPPEDLVELSKTVVDYTKGNPLALKVLGSSLYRKSKQDWESAMHNLKMIGDPRIFDVLKISYERLNRDEKNIFLDIACFFNGDDSDHVIKILDGCYLSMHFRLSVLIDKSLITILDKKLQMHDLLQEMGQEIVYRESEKKPGERSRLWNYEDVSRVLQESKGTDAVEGIFLDMSRIREVHLCSRAFINMTNLRLLKISKPWYLGDYVDISKVLHLPNALEYLPNEWRYLHWDGYALETLPSKFSPEKLVELTLPYSNIRQLWEGTKHALKLKSINLCFSKHFTEFPNLSKATKIETINLEGCKSLLDICSSIQYLTNLHILNLSGCDSLRSFPSNIHFSSPITLNLSNCISLTKFPHILGNVKELNLTRTAIEEVPESIASLTELVELNMSFCRSLNSLSTSICKLKSLRRLNLFDCLKLESFPEILEKMESLEVLNLGRTAIRELPYSIEHLDELEELRLEQCKNLESIPNNICNLTSLRNINLNDCPKLGKLPENLGNLICLESLYASRSPVSRLPSSMGYWKEIRSLSMGSCNLTEIPEDLCYLSLLEKLDLSENNFQSLPSNMKQLSKLRFLYLTYCSLLQSIPELPLGLKFLNASNCKQLQSLPEASPSPEELDESKLQILFERYSPFSRETVKFLFINCKKLNQKECDHIMSDSQQRIQNMATAALRLCCEKVFDEIPKISLCLPGNEIPDWFSHRSSGSSVTIELPQYFCNRRLIGFALSAVIEFEKSYYEHRIEVKCKYNFQTNCDWDNFEWDCVVKQADELIDSNHIVLGYIPFMDKGLFTTVSFKFSSLNISRMFSVLRIPPGRPLDGCKIKCCGVHPLYVQVEQCNLSNEISAATNEELAEANTSASGNGSSIEEVEPNANTESFLGRNCLLLFSCWNFIVSFLQCAE